MSAALGMVKFKTTGNIYMCCYEGTTDIMLPFIFKPEECLDENGYYCAISYGRKLTETYKNNWDISYVNDIDDIELYSDYGYGFYWQGKGSESAKIIIKGIDFGEEVLDYINGKPKWVTAFWDNVK